MTTLRTARLTFDLLVNGTLRVAIVRRHRRLDGEMLKEYEETSEYLTHEEVEKLRELLNANTEVRQ